MLRRFRSAFAYLKAAPWPHGTALGSLSLAVFLGLDGWWLLDDGHPYEAAALWLWAGGWSAVSLFALADGIARHREYRRIKAMLRRHGYRDRIMRLVARSRCQRDAAMLAARESGCRGQAAAYFRSLGYRWYHILPDTVVHNPLVFLSPRFVRTSFLPGKKARQNRYV
ncbi:hypothetical protein [Salidesulfovibrio onnuriiensis]|uniref:hypothetical protein n=1 Tax=Salidesulfovibrio onnuriiensis TaxID=2583823 RepID=UPI0011C7A206|nr:hypothetical protein [Salidesulfovibrio onnuriiensis]